MDETKRKSIDNVARFIEQGNYRAAKQSLILVLREGVGNQEAAMLLAAIYEHERKFSLVRLVLINSDEAIAAFEERINDTFETERRRLPRYRRFVLALILFLTGGSLIALSLPSSVPLELTEFLFGLDLSIFSTYSPIILVIGGFTTIIGLVMIAKWPWSHLSYKLRLTKAYPSPSFMEKAKLCACCGLLTIGSRCIHCGVTREKIKKDKTQKVISLEQMIVVKPKDEILKPSVEEDIPEDRVRENLSKIILRDTSGKANYKPFFFQNTLLGKLNLQRDNTKTSNPLIGLFSFAIEWCGRKLWLKDSITVQPSDEILKDVLVDDLPEIVTNVRLSQTNEAKPKEDLNSKGESFRNTQFEKIKEQIRSSMNGGEVVGRLSLFIYWWKSHPLLKASSVGLSISLICFIFFAGGLGLYFSITSRPPKAEGYATANDKTKTRWAKNFDPHPPSDRMSWDEYRNYSEGLLNWLEFSIIPASIEAAQKGDRELIEQNRKFLWKLKSETEVLYKIVNRPTYGGNLPTAKNFQAFLLPQKIARDRTALHSAAWFVSMISAVSTPNDPNIRRMQINQEVDNSLWRTKSTIEEARQFEEQSKRVWGIEE